MLAGSRKPKVVIDTNVFVSGLNFAGKPGEVLDLFMNMTSRNVVKNMAYRKGQLTWKSPEHPFCCTVIGTKGPQTRRAQ